MREQERMTAISKRKIDHQHTDALLSKMPPSILEGMEQFNAEYYHALESISPTLTKAIELLKQTGGKQIRPLLLLLTGSAFGQLTEQLINGAIFIEMFHLSTLIHDDVVDESQMRRGKPSLNALFGNRKAVLIGDYVLAVAMTKAMLTNHQQIVASLAELGKELSEGEIMQMDVAELGTYSEEQYYRIIQRKTASLIRSSMRIGATLAGVTDGDLLDKIGRAALLLGEAFQIRDDIFDYLPTKQLGKPSGQDLLEHKITLPLIYALEKGGGEAEKIKKLLRHELLKPSEVAYITQYAVRAGGVQYAEGVMLQKVEQAKQLLLEAIPEGECLEGLLAIADYIIERNK